MGEKNNFKQALSEIMGIGMVAEDKQEEPVIAEPQLREETMDKVEMKQATTYEGLKLQTGVTTIAPGTVIVGELCTEESVDLFGSIKGKISSKGDIKANGKVLGDLTGKDISLNSCEIQGNIFASGNVSLDEESLAVGDIKCESFNMDGKLKGNVTVENEAKFDSKAILLGNVSAASIAMMQGTKIQGIVTIPVSGKESDVLFDVDISI